MTPEQLEQFILTHQRSLELFASQWTTSPEDCVQEAFLRLHHKGQSVTNKVAWLYRVVRNLAIDQRRSNSNRSDREKVVGQRRSLFLPKSNHAIDSDELQTAIEQLPASQREIVIARIWGKLTLEEISESFEIAVSTAHRRYVTGIKQLQEHFEISCLNQKKQ